VEQIQEISQAFQWAVPGDTPNENLTALINLGDTERAAAGEFYTGYLRAFAKNLTDEAQTPGVTPNVLSWSWNTGFYRAAGVPFHVLEDILKELTLSGGVTILVASGDNGAAATEEACLPADDPLVGNQYAAWPVISPWVTVVGATQFLDGPDEAVSSSSTGTDGCTSGGGFAGPSYPAELYSTPAWQKNAVRRYLDENNATTFAAFPTAATPGWNPTGRAYPDISMYGAGISVLNVEDPDDMKYTAGTSFSAPFLAAFFSLANEALLRDGYDVIGYANPMLYWMGENCTDAFNDITIGDNQAGKWGDECLFGFPAASGWDAATGLGSARFEPFVSCAKRYQDEVRNKGLELLPDGSYRGSPTGGPTPLSLVALAVTLASLLTGNRTIEG
jgi:subtilase family serine protease